MRWDGILPIGNRDELVANVDVTATLLDAANVDPGWPMEGTSVFDSVRSSVVLEGIENPRQPAYCGVRLRNWLYVDWSGDAGKEMYNYVHDPLELSNLAGQPEHSAKEAELRNLMTTLCSPLPPGYVS
jgi:arylsulfatase A-like enzyme